MSRPQITRSPCSHLTTLTPSTSTDKLMEANTRSRITYRSLLTPTKALSSLETLTSAWTKNQTTSYQATFNSKVFSRWWKRQHMMMGGGSITSTSRKAQTCKLIQNCSNTAPTTLTTMLYVSPWLPGSRYFKCFKCCILSNIAFDLTTTIFDLGWWSQGVMMATTSSETDQK